MARKKRRDDGGGDDPRWTWELAPAPGELRLVHAFVVTGEGRERLSSPGALADWLALWELTPAAAELGAAELEQALEVRRAMRALIAANSGVALDKAEVKRLDHALRHIPFRLRFRDGVVRYEPDADGFDGALARLAAVLERTREGPWRRLKVCRDESCARVFYDSSRTITGKWCTPRCGSRLSARRYRQRFKRRHGRTPGARIRKS